MRLLAAALGLALASPAAAGGKLPSIILISIDTLRADRLGCYGYTRPTSPTLDALARESLVFEQNYSQSCSTAPSHMTILTGVLPATHAVTSWGEGPKSSLSDRLPTLATLLGQAGYVTGAHTGGGNVHSAFGFDQGFDGFVMAPWGGLDLVGEALSTLARQRRGRPLFFFGHTYQVHGPYVPRADYARLFVNPHYAGRIVSSREELVRRAGTDAWERLHGPFWKTVDRRDPADVRHLVDLYDAGIRQADDALASFLRRFREAGLDRDAILVIVSDHGEEFMEHGALQHGAHLYEEALRVPLLVRLPGGLGARRVPGIARNLDIVPTLLELVGLELPKHLQGGSLIPLLEGRDLRRPAYAEFPAVDLQSLRIGDWKYIRHGGTQELFDLAQDPGETRNRLTPATGYEWRNRVERILEASLQLGESFRPGGAPPLDPETRKQLEALGYLR